MPTSNRVTDTFSFDATDQTIADNATNFTYDSYGNLTRSGTSSVTSTTYAYDLADRLSSITQADGSVVGFSFDAAGRHATRTGTGGTTIDTYGYLGTSDSVIRDVSSSGAGYTLVSAIDSAGDRLASSQGSGYAWVIADLHGNVAAQCSSGTITDVFRYDAYGKTIGTSLLGTIASPWRYQGRILESTPASSGTNAEVYDAGARAYVPDLGTFTSLDSVSGSAQNPLSLNRYLYANANPETLVDPSGHGSMSDDIYDYQHPLQNTTDMSTSVYNYQHPFIGSGDMSTDIYNYQHPRGSGGGAPPIVGNAATGDATHSSLVSVPTTYLGETDSTKTNIAAENAKNADWVACYKGDQSACKAMNTIAVDTGDPVAAGLGAVNGFWQHTGGAALEWIKSNPWQAIGIAGAALALGAACVLGGCEALAAGFAVLELAPEIGLGLAAFGACVAACFAVETMGPLAIVLALTIAGYDADISGYDPGPDPHAPPPKIRR